VISAPALSLEPVVQPEAGDDGAHHGDKRTHDPSMRFNDTFKRD